VFAGDVDRMRVDNKEILTVFCVVYMVWSCIWCEGRGWLCRR